MGKDERKYSQEQNYSGRRSDYYRRYTIYYVICMALIFINIMSIFLIIYYALLQSEFSWSYGDFQVISFNLNDSLFILAMLIVLLLFLIALTVRFNSRRFLSVLADL